MREMFSGSNLTKCFKYAGYGVFLGLVSAALIASAPLVGGIGGFFMASAALGFGAGGVIMGVNALTRGITAGVNGVKSFFKKSPTPAM